MEYENDQRMAGSYAIRSAFFINGKEIVFGIDDKEKEPYLVAHCKYDNPFGVPEYYNCVAFDDYAEAMELLGRRISQEAEMSMETTIRRGVSNTLTAEDCIPGSRSGEFSRGAHRNTTGLPPAGQADSGLSALPRCRRFWL